MTSTFSNARLSTAVLLIAVILGCRERASVGSESFIPLAGFDAETLYTGTTPVSVGRHVLFVVGTSTVLTDRTKRSAAASSPWITP